MSSKLKGGLLLKADPENSTKATSTMDVMSIFRKFFHIEFTDTPQYLGMRPQTIPFEDLSDYINERRAKDNEGEVTDEELISICNQAVKQLDKIGFPAQIVFEDQIEIRDTFVINMAKLIINGGKGKHRTALLGGGTGIGKTERILQACELANIKREDVGYFSLPTLAPEDFAGIPSPHPEQILEFYYRMPKGINQYKVMILDEFNRAHPKVLNALMQLMLDRSINGMRFDNLQAILCAMNTADSGDFGGIEELDDAVRERFDHFYYLEGQYNPAVIGKAIGNDLVADIGVRWATVELTSSSRKFLNPRRLEKILRSYVLGEDIHTAYDKKRCQLDTNRLETMLKSETLLTLEQLIADPEAVRARLEVPGQESADLKVRFKALVDQMNKKQMRREFCKVAHLYGYIIRDQLPRVDRDKSLYAFMESAMKKYATKEESDRFFNMLKERISGRDSIAHNIAAVGTYLREEKDSQEAKAAF